ncbi:MAG: metallophosphoesterase [Xanthobacteraceae bacterium]
MLTLAHLSDLHLAIEPRGSQLLGKRGLGLINWRRKRKTIHRRDVLDALTRDLKAQHAGHIAVTGDLVNFSLPAEYALAGDWLRSLGEPRDVTALPGNHDVYVRGVEAMPAQYWADYMRGDDGLDRFPFVRRRDELALIALSSAVATGPFMATGTLAARQLARFAEALDQTRDAFRVVLIHHPPWSPPQRYLRRLTDAAPLRRVLAEKGAELLLHGHDHRSSLIWLDGPGGTKIPVAGVPSASAASAHGEEGAAAYHLFTIDGTTKAGQSRCEMIVRQRTADGTMREVGRKELF